MPAGDRIDVGDLFEDARLHPALCVARDDAGGVVTGVSLVDGHLTRAGVDDAAARRMTLEQAVERRLGWNRSPAADAPLRTLAPDEVPEDFRGELVATLHHEAGGWLLALGVEFEDRQEGSPRPSRNAMVAIDDGTPYYLRWFYERLDPFIWVIAERTDEETPEPAVRRFLAAARLGWSDVLMERDRWEPAEGRRGHSARWGSVTVRDDGRTLEFGRLELPAGGPWAVEGVEVVEHADVVEATVRLTNDPPSYAPEGRPAIARLALPLGDRPVVDPKRGRLVRQEPPPPDVPVEAVRHEEAVVPHHGVLVVRWKSSMMMGFAGVDVDLDPAGDRATVTVREWDRGGRLGYEQRVAVVRAPGLSPGMRLDDGAAA